MFLSGMILIFPGPILDSLITKFSLTQEMAGRLPFLFFAGGFLGQLFLSEIVRMFGTRKTFLFDLLAAALALGLIGFSRGYYQLLPLFFLAGFVNNMLFTLPGVIVTREGGKQVGSKVTYLYAFFSLGVTLGPILAGVLIRRFGYPAVLFQLALCAAAIFCWSLFKPAPEIREIEKMNFAGISRLLKSSGALFFLLLLGQFFYVAAEQGISVWLPKSLLERFPAENIEHASLLLAGIWAAMSAGRFLFGWMSKHIDRSILLFALALVSLGSSAAAALIPGRTGCELLYLAFGLGMSGIYPLIVSYTEGFPPRLVSMGLGLILAFSSLGGALGSYPVGILAEKIGFSQAMLYPASLLIFLLLIFPFLKKAALQK